MRLLILAAALLGLIAAPAAAQKPDAEQGQAVDLESLLGLQRPDPARLRAAIEAAEAHPLGSMQNPVRVGSPEGERAYMARLRCADGRPPRIGQRVNAGFGPFYMIVDVYPLDCGDAAPGRASLAMDMYHPEHREHRAPPGFAIVPR